MTTSAPLETSQLGHCYGRHWALRDCSLRLPEGRIAALVGPNGAGKTTLLHLCGRPPAAKPRRPARYPSAAT